MPSSRNALFNRYNKVLEIKSPFRLAVASPMELLVVGRGYLGGGFVQLPHALAVLTCRQLHHLCMPPSGKKPSVASPPCHGGHTTGMEGWWESLVLGGTSASQSL